MHNLKRLLSVLFVVVVATVILLFVLENQQTVALTLFGWTAPEMPVAVLVVLVLLVGLLIGPLIGAFLALRKRRRVGA
ncbi:DUF1049 domain-containing protein [Pseudomonas sp. JQ170]|uniref:lipopolysaccharide assembly protein LapA domain-containing protein n=1 Tax=unclassified Pseudomonas TaxID=196821 RepID=UPI0026569E15|nr:MULTISPECIES: lipopolysaccharide assembly protein LapA domain-containing protein [unclassified Pseudomonas]MDN7141071.1 DUF1049 domain-containing protein [Pseudomonas sp. JQ170]WRO74834.1 lipopolysaccharide assembly protein LapA domain-containing protein [Pseudomonas sp. 170C]